MQRRVVISGLGIISSLGNCYDEVISSIRSGRSGIKKFPKWEELGLNSTVGGSIEGVDELRRSSGIPKRKLACMSNVALYAVLAAKQAIEDSHLTAEDLRSEHTGCIVGSGIGCVYTSYQGGAKTYEGDAKHVSPYSVVRAMASSCSANITNVFPVGGRSYSVSSACSTAVHNIGHGFELIKSGILDTALAGGAEDVHELITSAFSALRVALSTHFNDAPEKASRPYDKNRDGFVISGGAGIVILEELERAKARGAHIYGEIVGYGANSDGYDMLQPEASGARGASCLKQAIAQSGANADEIDYINTHGTSTVIGDIVEIRAMQNVFGTQMPPISSTKSMGGHAIGASGAHELIHCVGMLENGFIAPSINIESLDDELRDVPIVCETQEQDLNLVLSNSFGFGGTNGVIALRRCL